MPGRSVYLGVSHASNHKTAEFQRSTILGFFCIYVYVRTRAIPERFCGGVSLRRGAISSVCTFTFICLHP